MNNKHRQFAIQRLDTLEVWTCGTKDELQNHIKDFKTRELDFITWRWSASLGIYMRQEIYA